jgi:lysophospholipase L1-like esterase
MLSLISVLLFFGLFEAGLRLAGLPLGKYRFMFDRSSLLYEPSTRIETRFGPVAYTIETNSLGMRSDEIGVVKPEGVVRIAALGDSATDGFFVDNAYTYPALLQRTLRERGHAVEVMNAGHGGASIGQEFRVLRGVTHLSPDLVVLTFCTNDISEILGKSPDQLVRSSPDGETVGYYAARMVISHTAIGEFLLDAFIRLRSRSESPETFTSRVRAGEAGRRQALPRGYSFPGGDAFARNVETFRERYADTDGLVLDRDFSPETELAVTGYLETLGRVLEHCRRHGIELVLSYLPAYPEVYDPSSPMKMRKRLARWSEEAGLAFLDLTPRMRERGAGRPLHLTPADFHPNPRGNLVIAETVAEFLVRHYPELFSGSREGEPKKRPASR